MNPVPSTRYSILVQLFDHSAALAQPRVASSLLPNTASGLPSATEHALRASLPLVLPQSFWQRLPPGAPLNLAPSEPKPLTPLASPLARQSASKPDKSRDDKSLHISSEHRVEYESGIRTKDLYVPSQGNKTPAVSKSSSTQGQEAILDFRFGPISLDWVDFPPPHLQSQSMTSNTSTPISLAAQSGSTRLNWGIIHLYRESGAASSPSTQAEKEAAVAADGGTIVGLVSVPGNLSVAQLLGFIAPALKGIVQLRMLRDSSPNRNLVLIKFRERSEADEFRRVYLGKPFFPTSDSEVCQVVPISSVKLAPSPTPPFTFPYSGTTPEMSEGGMVELPNCPICLERLDGNVSGLITVSCGHDFHCRCLLKWGDSRCPVCRSTSSRNRKPLPPRTSCAICLSRSNLWQCLICGNVGCGRYQGGHAYQHYDELSGHAYALEVETGRIWAYEGDRYVHRLIREGGDGRLVELPSLTSSDPSSSGIVGEGKGKGPDLLEETQMRKIEAYSIELTDLLATQLGSQRGYYEEEISRHQLQEVTVRERLEREELSGARRKTELEEMGKRLIALELRAATKQADLTARLEALTMAHSVALGNSKKVAIDLVKSRKLLEKDLEAERFVSASLLSNLGTLRGEKEAKEKENDKLREGIKELEEENRDVMFALTARDQIANQGLTSELVGGSISAPPPPLIPTPSPTGGKKKKKR